MLISAGDFLIERIMRQTGLMVVGKWEYINGYGHNWRLPYAPYVTRKTQRAHPARSTPSVQGYVLRTPCTPAGWCYGVGADVYTAFYRRARAEADAELKLFSSREF
jgi:hypothetical protein